MLTWVRAHLTASDVGILVGLGLCDYALFQWSAAAGWLFLGVVVIGISAILGLPPVNPPPSPPTGAP